ncbi:MAG TPA: hypothetical protein PKK10_11655 [Woeseiaceae bacterium]|nr:hypothetical protein [Woeseiaceae bacterium]
MNKKELFDAFDGQISKTAIVPTCDEPGHYKIVGRYGEIEPMVDGSWDVWLTDTTSAAATLSERKVTGMLDVLSESWKASTEDTYKIYRGSGESWVSLPGIAAVRAVLPVLKVRRKKQLSEDSKRKLVVRLAELRAAA